MNHVVWSESLGGKNEYYVASVRKHSDKFGARGKRVSPEGKLLQVCAEFVFGTEAEAERKCRDLVKTKLKNGWVLVSKECVKEQVAKHFEVPPDTMVTPEQLMKMLVEAKKERYVVLADVSGIEAWFDAGVQYLGSFESGDECVKVYDRFGEPRDCFIERVDSMELTERALEAKETAGRFGY